MLSRLMLCNWGCFTYFTLHISQTCQYVLYSMMGQWLDLLRGPITRDRSEIESASSQEFIREIPSGPTSGKVSVQLRSTHSVPKYLTIFVGIRLNIFIVLCYYQQLRSRKRFGGMDVRYAENNDTN